MVWLFVWDGVNDAEAAIRGGARFLLAGWGYGTRRCGGAIRARGNWPDSPISCRPSRNPCIRRHSLSAPSDSLHRFPRLFLLLGRTAP